jgi:hypothetical protein
MKFGSSKPFANYQFENQNHTSKKELQAKA